MLPVVRKLTTVAWLLPFLALPVVSCSTERDQAAGAAKAGSGGTSAGTAAAGGDGGAGGEACELVLEDRDADGVAGLMHCRRADSVPLEGAVFVRDDCDDEDPRLFRLVYVDADRDGYGGSDRWCVGEELPEGAATYAGDCDDADAARHMFAAEQWQDGIDSNCDGSDDLISCEKWPDVCDCPSLKLAPLLAEVDADCELADLAVTSAKQCFLCDPVGNVSLVITNHGRLAASAVSVELWNEDGLLPSVVLPGPLESGAVALPLNIVAPHGVLHVRLHTETEDCDASNDEAELKLERYHCPVK